MKIKDSTVLVTGANRGLGFEFTQVLLEMGAKKVYAAARNPETIKLHGVIPIKLDITNQKDVENVSNELLDINMLINNAGIHKKTTLLDDDSIEIVKDVLNTNLIGISTMSKFIAPIIIKNGGGAIVNVLSAGCWLNGHGNLAYSISKAAALSLTNDMRLALNSKGVQVSAIHAGFIDTDMMASFQGKKLSPYSVAYDSLLAVNQGSQEILIDEMSKKSKLHSIDEIPNFSDSYCSE
ncbi:MULTISPECIES: SDR family NAD(P)-dependent oxidoreductase [Clostridium]|uniref:SDR family oxidoreductase n=2 Tax=Clostridium TaxID=1485 RepID=A0A2U8DLC4_9CLOT|nr:MULTISPECIES: SDR family NAD(P)-dependent oxidoreductase [Clostridium]AKA70420.1 putative short-chain dehydrogenase/reductase [Clostridium scatologenes]AWI03540.1 SDR family oxidoreductase [Clostridium drakei]